MDPSFRPDVIAMIAASSALMLAGVPFDGPIAGLRIGRVNGEYQAFLSPEQREASDLDLVVAGKDTDFFGTVTTSDLTLFHLDDKKNNVYSVVDQINFSLYDLYKLDKAKFEEFTSEVEYRIEKFWNFHSIDLMRYLVVDAYNDGNYKLAKKYGLYYTDKVDYINELVNPILAEISYKEGNKKEALKYFKICLKNYLCDLEDNETYKELLDKDER